MSDIENQNNNQQQYSQSQNEEASTKASQISNNGSQEQNIELQQMNNQESQNQNQLQKQNQNQQLEQPVENINEIDIEKQTQIGNLVPQILAIQNNLMPNNLIDSTGYNILHHAVSYNKLNGIIPLIKELKIDVDIFSNTKQTPLNIASNYGFLKIMKALIDLGAKVNHVDDNSFSSLLYAVRMNKTQAVLYLISLGADLNAQDLNGCGIVHWAAYNNNTFLLEFFDRLHLPMNSRDKQGYTPFLRAIFNESQSASQSMNLIFTARQNTITLDTNLDYSRINQILRLDNDQGQQQKATFIHYLYNLVENQRWEELNYVQEDSFCPTCLIVKKERMHHYKTQKKIQLINQIHPEFGDTTPFAEPYWYQNQPSPYYTENHIKFREKVRNFVENEIMPHKEQWLQTGYPIELEKKFYQAGIGGIIYDKKYGGYKPEDFDYFYEQIMIDEIQRSGLNVLGGYTINSLVVPLLLKFGDENIKQNIATQIIKGEKMSVLAISEPYAGSDVANVQTTAHKEGDYYVINGVKKWITGGLNAKYICTLARTGGPGMSGLSLLIIDSELPGVKIRKMETQFDNAHSTTFITLTNVKVHKSMLIGKEGQGFKAIMLNFNHERWIIAIGSVRQARNLYTLSFKYALKRKTFNQPLINHQIIRYKLAQMARQIESCYSQLEMVTNSFNFLDEQALATQCSLLKVNCANTFEFCAREASQIFGGNSIVKEGQGKEVERAVRGARVSNIYGGSEEIMLDLAIRQQIQKVNKQKTNSKI
ncbi:Ankyrin repeat-containing domain [Pseudocohnilembus persalinus]|uniref:Ankyrin repeat-containing domain n=1 Tax=Pseudocohnilembus persalinus TaxID=266149 RepID=A0A0V0QYG0_PSEPJ|nr:Ankyrin repeat-containing domain [Pseudocohnilembus persalinus]|eukprot:KRX07246.1 Ankyrin repeat-containing domain [Pseudocohnilembus persalinus]